MRKEHRLQIIDLHHPREKQYQIDQVISSMGNGVVWFTLYMCDLNLVELA